MNEVKFYGMTKEEEEACRNLILNMREEARRKKEYEALKGFRHSVQALIDMFGLEEAKRIVREMNRELRGF